MYVYLLFSHWDMYYWSLVIVWMIIICYSWYGSIVMSGLISLLADGTCTCAVLPHTTLLIHSVYIICLSHDLGICLYWDVHMLIVIAKLNKSVMDMVAGNTPVIFFWPRDPNFLCILGRTHCTLYNAVCPSKDIVSSKRQITSQTDPTSPNMFKQNKMLVKG